MREPQENTDSEAPKHRARTAIAANKKKEASKERPPVTARELGYDPLVIQVHVEPNDVYGSHIAPAKKLMTPAVQAASTIHTFGQAKTDINAYIVVLEHQVELVNNGDLKQVEGMLVTQAYTLNELFNNLARRAFAQQQLRQYEAFLRLALKAQSQCRTTLETLALLKNPPNVAFVRQTNIAAGHQQINNRRPVGLGRAGE